MTGRLFGLVLLLSAAGPATAALPPAAVDALKMHCPVPALLNAPGALEPIEAQLSLQPAQALAAACALAALPTAAEPLRREAAVLAAQALQALSRGAATSALLDSLKTDAATETGSDADLRWRARWYLAAGLRAGQISQWPTGITHLGAAQQLYLRAGLEASRGYVMALIGQAQGLRSTGQLELATARAAQADALLTRHGLRRTAEMGELLNVQALLAYDRQDLPGTVAYTRQELKLSRELGIDEIDFLDAYATLGAVLSLMGRDDEALVELEAALLIIERRPGENVSAMLGVLHNLASMLIDKGRSDRALPIIERGLAQAEQTFGADSPRNLALLIQRSSALVRMSRYGAASQSMRRAMAIEQRQGAAAGQLRSLRLISGLADIHFRLGDLEAARAVVQTGLARTQDKPELSYWTGRYRRVESAVSAREGRLADADVQLEAAVRLVGGVIGPQQPFVLSLLADRCAIQAQARLPGQACEELRRQLPLLDNADATHRYKAHAALALDDEAAGRRELALNHRLAALAAAESTGSADPRWSALDELARDMRQRGSRQLAIYLGKQAIAAVEDIRREVGQVTAESERRFLLNKLAVYRRVAQWQFEDGRVAEGLATLRLLKEEEFLDFVQRDAGLQDPRVRAGGLSVAEQAMAARWQTLPSSDAGAPSATAPLQRETEWARQARRLLDELSLDGTPSTGARAMAPRSRPDTVIPEGELHLYVLAATQQVTLVFDARGRRSVVNLAWDQATAGREVGVLLSALGRGDEALPGLQAMYRRVGAPLADAARAAQARRVVLHLDGVLRYLPWSALHDGRRYLGELYTFESRLQAREGTPTRSPGSAARVAALGVTREFEGLKPLRGVAQELCSIVAGPVLGLNKDDGSCAPDGAGQGVVQGQAWLNGEFTGARLQQVTRQPVASGSMLHVGTHFNLRPGNMARSWLLLGDGSRLTLDDVARLSFSGHDLVTLSACETGLGGAADADGREVDGLNLLVIRRGAAAVLASLWRVDDQSTGALMREFYRQLARVGPAQALRLAQQHLRNSDRPAWRSPYHWAGFYLTQRSLDPEKLRSAP